MFTRKLVFYDPVACVRASIVENYDVESDIGGCARYIRRRLYRRYLALETRVHTFVNLIGKRACLLTHYTRCVYISE